MEHLERERDIKGGGVMAGQMDWESFSGLLQGIEASVIDG